ncbi:glycosyltransferase family 8 protein [Anaerobacillus alkaliphilus]|uniref:Glycosyltransferase family 8 protein n=1 Tax=Anaerobacillus alkaliphilus TaxID=1548597 RepID=A0A4Q0VPV9_9BACI|nr:glycosyltransferase family 8 protein [Anaerobacillus alkaliphilus]RXI98199.1 glycosyltransferase family 8 protein [Anaerobacillus alkaliphilus]
MYIVSATNENYAEPLAVMLTSLLKNRKHDSFVHIFILYGDLIEVTKAKLERAIKKYNGSVTFIKMNVQLFENFPLSRGGQNYISHEAYYRILIPEVLSKDISRALYLDCDMIVRDDISKLWEISIEGYDLAAVDESRVLSERKRDKRINRLSLPTSAYYFNSGLLFMNLKRWREKRISTEVIQFIEANPNKLNLLDQDALNAVLHNRWLRLGDKWNFTKAHSKRLPLYKAAILHFTGPDKPWDTDNPFYKEYLNYLKKSMWKKPIQE